MTTDAGRPGSRRDRQAWLGHGKRWRQVPLPRIWRWWSDIPTVFHLDRKPFPGVANIMACTGVGFLAGSCGSSAHRRDHRRLAGERRHGRRDHVGSPADFVRQVEALLKPGTSALVRPGRRRGYGGDSAHDQGLGGTVLRRTSTGRANLIQPTLAVAATGGYKHVNRLVNRRRPNLWMTARRASVRSDAHRVFQASQCDEVIVNRIEVELLRARQVLGIRDLGGRCVSYPGAGA